MAVSLVTVSEFMCWEPDGTQLPGLFFAIALDGVDPQSIPKRDSRALMMELAVRFASDFKDAAQVSGEESYARDFVNVILAIHEAELAYEQSESQ